MKIEGNVNLPSAVEKRIGQLPARVQTALERKITQLTIKLQRKVVAEKLQGQVLKVRTGRLQRSITQAVQKADGSVIGVVSTAVKYARPLEYGFAGTVNVREHLRTITQAFGKQLKEPVTVTVKAHTARLNLMPPHSFLRTALKEMEPEILAGIDEAIKGALK
jgi:hypothetical protein